MKLFTSIFRQLDNRKEVSERLAGFAACLGGSSPRCLGKDGSIPSRGNSGIAQGGLTNKKGMMMSRIGMRDASRTDWQCDHPATIDSIKLGCLLRIADATELMAKNYAKLLKERDFAVRERNTIKANRDSWVRRCSALRGVITKLKKAVKP